MSSSTNVPALAPVSPQSSRGSGESIDRLIEEAFGGKLWYPLEHPLAGVSACTAAQKRLLYAPPSPPGMSPTEILKHLGLFETETTAHLFSVVELAAVNNLPGTTTVALAVKWFAYLSKGLPITELAFDNLDEQNPTMSFNGSTIRLFTRLGSTAGESECLTRFGLFCNKAHTWLFAFYFSGTGDGNGDEEQEGKEENKDEERNPIEDRMERFLTSDVPEGHRRFFHGTDSISAAAILEYGIDKNKFFPTADFGPAFYCAERFVESFKYGIMASVMRKNSSRGAVMSFDVPEDSYDGLESWVLENPNEWGNLVFKCYNNELTQGFDGHESAEVVVGLVSSGVGDARSPDSVRASGAGDVMQHAFRGDSAHNLLHANLAKVRVALFEVAR